MSGKIYGKAAMILLFTAVILCTLLLCGCSGDDPPVNPGTITDDYIVSVRNSVEMPEMGNNIAAENEYAAIEVSHINDGYFYVELKKEPEQRLKLQVTKGDDIYYYDLFYDGEPCVFPLQLGNGAYKIKIYRNVEASRYSFMIGTTVTVKLSNENAAFLLPSQIVSYSRDSDSITQSINLTFGAENDLAKVQAIFEWIVKNIDYDYPKAATVESGYLPDVDETLRTKKGICFDYAALFAAMLRANGIPAKLIIGYADPGNVYHAWNMVYITDIGWMSAEIYFDGENWQLADATFAASNSTSDHTYYPVYEY